MKKLMITTAVVAALALGACGGGGGGGTKKAEPASDKTAAEKITLKPADFPSGWTSTPHQASPDSDANNARFAQCIGRPDPKTLQTADVNSPDFKQGQTTQASSEVTFVRTEADAKDDLAALQTGKGPDCIKQLLQAAIGPELPAGATTADVRVEQLQFPTLKDGTAAFRLSFTIGTAGLNVPVYADVIFFRAGRAEIALASFNAGTPFDSKLEEALAKKMADRA